MDYTSLPNENEHLEYKSNQSKLSKDLWETISAFENTDGGLLILGVDEVTKNGIKSFIPLGINNTQQVLDDFWSTIGNTINYSTIKNDDVKCINLEDDISLIEITVHEATFNKKPIYSKGSAYVRKGAVDIKAKKEDLQILLRDSRDDLDTKVLPNYSMEDLNLENIKEYQEIISKRSGYESYKDYSTEAFLKK
ncbi:helix-turn-helix domain-containing protein [Companilactobacillus kimchiensis]|uniref:Transcriptional regulator n=1 Tax=Companilactobacillus kimchiensis TaxID=993692 RepID=A0A0R2LA35_9LACO|nr:ATP-binding protein [Companilactobacillus kimchiensis]KRN98734.1 transcriptional regulator [Companilactobacillus kimchiensis]